MATSQWIAFCLMFIVVMITLARSLKDNHLREDVGGVLLIIFSMLITIVLTAMCMSDIVINNKQKITTEQNYEPVKEQLYHIKPDTK